jgi:hypothetical protein
MAAGKTAQKRWMPVFLTLAESYFSATVDVSLSARQREGSLTPPLSTPATGAERLTTNGAARGNAHLGAHLGNWLSGEFSLLGIHFQNWMPLFVAIVVLAVLVSWWISRR